MSLPSHLLEEFDQLIDEQGFYSRSQAITDLINKYVLEKKEGLDDTVMAGTINLVFNHEIVGVQKNIAELQYDYIDEVISNLNVNLTEHKVLSVILVQGPVLKLRLISDKLAALKGVESAELLVSTAILPPIHPMSHQP